MLRDSLRTIEIHEVASSVHVIQADAYTPGPAGSPPPPSPDANHVNLVQNIERLGLAPDRILPLHVRMVPMSELYSAIGRN